VKLYFNKVLRQGSERGSCIACGCFLQEIGGYGNKNGFGGGEDVSGVVGELAFDVVAAASGSRVTAAEGERDAEGDGAEVVDFEVPGHSQDAAGAIGFAHGFIEESGDDTAVGVAGRSGEAGGEAQVAEDIVVLIGEKAEAEACAVFEAAAEALVEGSVGEGGKGLFGVSTVGHASESG
jgi:hypothetical protein